MKKTLLVLLVAFLAIGFCFAEVADEQKDLGKIVVGFKAGYAPAIKMAQFDLDGKWQLDFEATAPFTTDVVAQFGVLTDFKGALLFDGFFGAGFTKEFAEGWDCYANAGLDALFAKGVFELGVAANMGVEYYPTEHIGVNANLKVTEYIKSRTVLFEPSVGMNYAF